MMQNCLPGIGSDEKEMSTMNTHHHSLEKYALHPQTMRVSPEEFLPCTQHSSFMFIFKKKKVVVHRK